MIEKVRVEAPARLHLGMFDLGGTLGRRFGGIGAAISRPQVVLTATAARELQAEGAEADRALLFARRYLMAQGIDGGAYLSVEESIPRHVGLGSGTKLALAVATALAALYEQPQDPASQALAVGRGSRSVIGLTTFAKGGFIVEGGQWPERETLAPVLARYLLPESWRCIIAIPDTEPGLSGRSEEEAFEQLSVSREQAAVIAHVVLMSLLPALAEGDLPEFGAALTEVQRLVGETFSPIQGDRYANRRSAALVEAMLAWGAAGAGQSSWGPAVFGLVDGDERGEALRATIADYLDGAGWVELVAFDNKGVRIQYL